MHEISHQSPAAIAAKAVNDKLGILEFALTAELFSMHQNESASAKEIGALQWRIVRVRQCRDDLNRAMSENHEPNTQTLEQIAATRAAMIRNFGD